MFQPPPYLPTMEDTALISYLKSISKSTKELLGNDAVKNNANSHYCLVDTDCSLKCNYVGKASESTKRYDLLTISYGDVLYCYSLEELYTEWWAEERRIAAATQEGAASQDLLKQIKNKAYDLPGYPKDRGSDVEGSVFSQAMVEHIKASWAARTALMEKSTDSSILNIAEGLILVVSQMFAVLASNLKDSWIDNFISSISKFYQDYTPEFVKNSFSFVGKAVKFIYNNPLTMMIMTKIAMLLRAAVCIYFNATRLGAEAATAMLKAALAPLTKYYPILEPIAEILGEFVKVFVSGNPFNAGALIKTNFTLILKLFRSLIGTVGSILWCTLFSWKASKAVLTSLYGYMGNIVGEKIGGVIDGIGSTFGLAGGPATGMLGNLAGKLVQYTSSAIGGLLGNSLDDVLSANGRHVCAGLGGEDQVMHHLKQMVKVDKGTLAYGNSSSESYTLLDYEYSFEANIDADVELRKTLGSTNAVIEHYLILEKIGLHDITCMVEIVGIFMTVINFISPLIRHYFPGNGADKMLEKISFCNTLPKVFSFIFELFKRYQAFATLFHAIKTLFWDSYQCISGGEKCCDFGIEEAMKRIKTRLDSKTEKDLVHAKEYYDKETVVRHEGMTDSDYKMATLKLQEQRNTAIDAGHIKVKLKLKEVGDLGYHRAAAGKLTADAVDSASNVVNTVVDAGADALNSVADAGVAAYNGASNMMGSVISYFTPPTDEKNK